MLLQLFGRDGDEFVSRSWVVQQTSPAETGEGNKVRVTLSVEDSSGCHVPIVNLERGECNDFHVFGDR
jgi:hypothetical protein